MVLTGTVVYLKSGRLVFAFFLPRALLNVISQDRFAGLSGARGRGGIRGGLRGLRGGLGRGGGLRGGYGGGAGRDFSNQDLYADYSGPDQQTGGAMRVDGYAGSYNGNGYAGGVAATAAVAYNLEPSQQIMVRNVRTSFSHYTSLPLILKIVAAALVHCERGLG